MSQKVLRGVRVAVLAADGFEQIEVTRPMRALQRAGADVRVISLRPGRIRGMNLMGRGRKLAVDDTVAKARSEDYSALLLPGGFVSPDSLRQNERALAFVRGFQELGRPIATLCHGPELLISARVVEGRSLTSWPGIADDVRNAGGLWSNQDVVVDGNLVSSRGPQDLPAFTQAMIDLFAKQADRDLPIVRPRVHWAAQLSRLGSLAVTGATVLGAHALWRRWPAGSVGRRRRTPGRVAADVLLDLGLATTFGGMLFGKIALDPAVRVLPWNDDRGRIVLAAWRRFALPSGLGLAAATFGWMGARRRVRATGWRRAGDLLLGGALVTGAANALGGAYLTRASSGALPMDTGRTAALHAEPGAARVLRSSSGAGMAQAGLLAGLIGVTAAMRG